MTLLPHIQAFLAAHGVLPGERVFVGFSGGIDSTALLLLLVESGVRPVAVHFQHGIRGDEAEGDAEWCRAFCAARQVEFRCARLNVLENLRRGEAVEEGARRLRMESWERLAADGGMPVFLAHHEDDVLEELFLRLARGANVTGLTGLRKERAIHGVRYLRPLLEVPKAALQAYLVANGVDDWRTDSTNLESEYRRNAVRNGLLPLFHDIFKTDAGLRRAVKVLRQDAECLENMAQDNAGKLATIHDWQVLPDALLPRVFRNWRKRQDGVDEAPERAFLAELKRRLEAFDGRPASIQMSRGVMVRLDNAGLHLTIGEEPATPVQASWNWRKEPEIHIPGLGVFNAQVEAADGTEGRRGAAGEAFALEAMPETLVIRTWLPGDRMVPFGMSHGKKLQDVFVDARVPRGDRARKPVVCADGQVVWIPGVKRAEFGRVAGNTAKVVVSYRPEE